MNLPTEVPIRHCESDNFLFVASGDQDSYDNYYKTNANDSYHAEVAGGDFPSPIAKIQRDHLLNLVGEMFGQSRNVLDFGCGEACLLLELAAEFPSSSFCGFEPGPGAQIGKKKAKALNLNNLAICDGMPGDSGYDLIVASHVVEHLVDFDLLHSLSSLLLENGLLYIEVPNALEYAKHQRLEFLYYFDRLHVNHFAPQSLARLAGAHGFGHIGYVEYTFPYRDGKPYPALGMLFRKGANAVRISSPSLLETSMTYIADEKKRAKQVRERLNAFEGVLVWGAGDNFFRSSENDGPLCDLQNMIVLDKKPQTIMIGGRGWTAEDPAAAIRRYGWPLVITVSEGRKAILQQVREIDSSKNVFFI